MSSQPHVSAANERILSLTNHLKDSLNPADDIHKAKMSAYKFQGWMGLDKESTKGNMKWQKYEPKTWTEDDVDIKITHCGICGSDIHTLRSGWVSRISIGRSRRT
jgi:alcohol dehydrogenase (NADP+)